MDDGAIPEPVRAVWQALQGGWDDPKRHEAFLGLVAQHNCFAWAAARYKERAGDAIADAQLAKLRNAATATMLATATAKPKGSGKPYQATIVLFIALMIFAVLGLVYVMHLHTEPSVPPPKAVH
jgi:hypothetical protein